MVTLRRRCSADLPTRQAVQMAREALRRGFVLPQTVCHPAIDDQVMSLAYLLTAYGLVSEPREPERIIAKCKSAAVSARGKLPAAADRPAEQAPPRDCGADTVASPIHWRQPRRRRKWLRHERQRPDCGRNATRADVHAMWHHALAIYLLIALGNEAVVVRLNIALMRSSDGRPGRWDAADVAGTVVLAMLWPISLVLLLT